MDGGITENKRRARLLFFFETSRRSNRVGYKHKGKKRAVITYIGAYFKYSSEIYELYFEIKKYSSTIYCGNLLFQVL